MTYRPVHGGNITWAAAIAGCSPTDLLDFSASINPLGPPTSVLQAIQAHLPDLTRYPDPAYGNLRQYLAAHHGLSPDWILPGNGAAELLTWVGRDLAQLATTVLPTPAFGDYGRAVRAFGGVLTPCPWLTGTGHDEAIAVALPQALQASLQAIPQPLQRLGLLLNTPHNPTGQLLSLAALEPLLEDLGLVVVDEAFMDFLPPDRQQSLIEQVPRRPNLVVLRSLTKFYSLPGLRIGYAIAHPDQLRRWQQWRDPWPVNTLAAAAAIAALQDTAFQQHTWDWLATAGPTLWQALAAIPGLTPLPTVANFILVRSAGSVTALQEALLRCDRILIRDCLSFPELGDHYFRVAIRTEEENQRLVRGLEGGLLNSKFRIP